MKSAYQKIKDYLIRGIHNGTWPRGGKIPSDSELIRQFSVSRMTVIRAVRELQQDGWVVRVPGKGSYVAETKQDVPVAVVQDIARDIERSGRLYSSDLIFHQKVHADDETTEKFGIKKGRLVFFCSVVHKANGIPVGLEERWVNPDFCSVFMQEDLRAFTPHQVLMRYGTIERVDHVIETIGADKKLSRLLDVDLNAPCLVVHRRTWSNSMVASLARFYYAGARHRISGTFYFPAEQVD